MNLIWGMLNDLSFMMSTSMIAIGVPGVASSIQAMILKFVYMDILMTDQWLSGLLDGWLTEDETESDAALNTYFDKSGFGSRFMMLNLGSTLVSMVLYLVAFAILGILKLMGSIFHM